MPPVCGNGVILVAEAGGGVAGASGRNLDTTQPQSVLCEANGQADFAVCVSSTTAQVSIVDGAFVYHDLDTFSANSNYGIKSIDVAAPGGYFSYPRGACSSFTLDPNVIDSCGGVKDNVIGVRGTGVSAPHVSGVLALILADQASNASPVAALRTLINSADDIGDKGTDMYFGRGRINAARALKL